MEKQKILLTMPKEWLEKLEKVRKKEYFTSIQEVIYDMIRNKHIRPKPESKTGRPVGRPRKFEFEDYFSKQTKASRKIEGKK